MVMLTPSHEDLWRILRGHARRGDGTVAIRQQALAVYLCVDARTVRSGFRMLRILGRIRQVGRVPGGGPKIWRVNLEVSDDA